MTLEADRHGRLLEHLQLIAPGTPLRDGFERILRGRTGALVVLGRNDVVAELCSGGFELSVPFTATALRELAKMDGAIVVDLAHDRIVQAGVQLMPDPRIPTVETGTRHRTADRVARQTGLPVVSVSASMSTIALYLDQERHLLEHSDLILSRANQALQTLERYRERLGQVLARLTGLEVQDQVTVKDVAGVAQRLEMIRRLEGEIDEYVISLGTDGRLLTLQLDELRAGLDELRTLLDQDYRPESATPDGDPPAFGLARLHGLGTTELLEPITVARALGFVNREHLDTKLEPRGYRHVNQINRLPAPAGARLIEHFGSLQALLAASSTELQAVDGVGAALARVIRDGLLRLAESAYSDRLD